METLYLLYYITSFLLMNKKYFFFSLRFAPIHTKNMLTTFFMRMNIKKKKMFLRRKLQDNYTLLPIFFLFSCAHTLFYSF